MIDDNGKEVFSTQFAAVGLDDFKFIMLKLQSDNFYILSWYGAQCNIISLALYCQATNDHKLRQVKPGKSQLSAYGGTTLPVTGQVVLRVEHGNHQYTLEYKLVNCTNIYPLLGQKACLNMKIVAYLDKDVLYKPHIGQATVFSLEPTSTVSQQQLIKKYLKEGVGWQLRTTCIWILVSSQSNMHQGEFLWHLDKDWRKLLTVWWEQTSLHLSQNLQVGLAQLLFPQKECHIADLSRSKRLEHSHPARALSTTHHRRCGNAPSLWGKSVYCIGCS